MLKEQAGHSEERLPQVDRQYLEHQSCENVRQVYQTLHISSLDQFTYARIDFFLDELNGIVHELEWVPEPAFQHLIQVLEGLSEARNELRLARFLFSVEEINPVYCLIMRNRAVLRAKNILHAVLLVWPARSESNRP